MAKTAAWTRKEGKNPEGGLNAKGRASAKAQGMKWSYKNGLMDRETNEIITKNPQEIAEKLINGTTADLSSVESIVKKIKARPDYEELVKDARDAFERDKLTLPEDTTLPGTGAWYRQFLNKRI